MSSSITLSAATRQNLLSLQDTADLLSTTQSRLSTGKKVNSALDSPVNFFTSQGLNSRSNGLSSLLDGISNGIQTIQAASQGITNLQKLTDQLKSTANQALSATNAFTAKAAVTSKALNGAVDSNLLSTGATQAVSDGAPSIFEAADPSQAQITTGGVTLDAGAITALAGKTEKLSVDGVNLSLTFGTGNITDQATLKTAITNQLSAAGSSVTVDITADKLVFTGATKGGSFAVGANADLIGTPAATQAAKIQTTDISGTLKATALGFTAGDSFTVNGSSVSVNRSDTIDTLAQKVVAATNGDVSAKFNSDGTFTFTAKDAKTSVNLGDGSTSTAKVANLGFTTQQFAAGKGSTGSTADLDQKVLTVQVGSGAAAKNVAVTFGSQTGQISTLDQLNAALAPADAQASIDSTGHLTITTTNDAGAQALSLGGSAVTDATNKSFLSSSSVATVGGDGQSARAKLANDYNNLLTQIDQLSKDSSFNGVNLLNGDQLKVVFNSDQSSSITVKGVATTADSLGLNTVSSDDFKDNDSINAVFSKIQSANNTLQSQASSYSSNLSVVQNRQDFSKNLINILDTGAANLTNADLNEEAANSQALSTRNSLGISALSLANQAQQGILQLLR